MVIIILLLPESEPLSSLCADGNGGVEQHTPSVSPSGTCVIHV